MILASREYLTRLGRVGDRIVYKAIAAAAVCGLTWGATASAEPQSDEDDCAIASGLAAIVMQGRNLGQTDPDAILGDSISGSASKLPPEAKQVAVNMGRQLFEEAKKWPMPRSLAEGDSQVEAFERKIASDCKASFLETKPRSGDAKVRAGPARSTEAQSSPRDFENANGAAIANIRVSLAELEAVIRSGDNPSSVPIEKRVDAGRLYTMGAMKFCMFHYAERYAPSKETAQFITSLARRNCRHWEPIVGHAMLLGNIREGKGGAWSPSVLEPIFKEIETMTLNKIMESRLEK